MLLQSPLGGQMVEPCGQLSFRGSYREQNLDRETHPETVE